MQHDDQTDFGFKRVKTRDKTNFVADVFNSVASRYDLMNDLMSFGLHRFWKWFAVHLVNLKPGETVLDVASGTGDIALALAKSAPKSKVVMTDINQSMLEHGRNKMTDAGQLENISYVRADAETLPFPNHYFDYITIAFGLRNVTNKHIALASMYRVLKPGGKLFVLEFSEAKMSMLAKFYDFYSFNIIPKIGKLITNDEKSYQYLVESIRMHPNQEKLKTMMEEAGFDETEYFNLCGGIVALHKGCKF